MSVLSSAKASRVRPLTRRPAFRGGTCSLFLALTLLLTAGNAIHPLLHIDAGAPNHDCAFVHWAHGEIGFAQSFEGLPRTEVTCVEQTSPLAEVLFPSPPEFPQNSRGPPAV